jgi:hypothetical protein
VGNNCGADVGGDVEGWGPSGSLSTDGLAVEESVGTGLGRVEGGVCWSQCGASVGCEVVGVRSGVGEGGCEVGATCGAVVGGSVEG